MNVFSSYASNVLTVRNFPLLFNDNDRQEFLEHFGAVRVRCLSQYKNLSNIIIADFGSPAQAAQALTRLHQLEILARRLTAEYSSLELVQFAFSSDISSYDESENVFLHGISPGKNQIYYSLPNERLSYSYPPINDMILTHINDALLSVPAFYTQVLHLMNKMSLPCPMIEDWNKNRRTLSINSIACQTDESVFSQVINMDTDDDESEIDDGEEEERVKRRQRLHLKTSTHREVQPNTQTETVIYVEKKKKPTIELKLPQTIRQYHMETDDSTLTDPIGHDFSRFRPIQSTIEIVQEDKQPLPLIPLEELRKNRLTEDQLRLIDNGRLYRNYERGAPSQRLYIKNIEIKHVDERILHSIYDRYRTDQCPIEIQLLREGKMKGQAFVTLPSEQLAFEALNHTNGYILFEKPLIVQFARTAKPKDIL